MKRILLVSAVAALLCLGVTGLRVALLQQMAAPERPAPTPQHIEQPEPPPAARPSEYLAASPTRRSARTRDAALIWAHARSDRRD